jgi:hypothetical protein
VGQIRNIFLRLAKYLQLVNSVYFTAPDIFWRALAKCVSVSGFPTSLPEPHHIYAIPAPEQENGSSSESYSHS